MLNLFEAKVQQYRNYGYTDSEAKFLTEQDLVNSFDFGYYGLESDPDDDYLGYGYNYGYFPY